MTEFTVMGCGPGSRGYLTQRASACLKEAALLAGTPQLLDLFADTHAHQLVCTRGITESWIDRLEATPARPCVVLIANDRGFAEAVQLFRRRFGFERCRVEPGVSVAQVVCVRLGLAWVRAAAVDFEIELPLENELPPDDHEPWIYFMGSKGAEQHVAEHLDRTGRHAVVIEDLSLESESVRPITAHDLHRLESRRHRIVVATRDAIPAPVMRCT